MNMRKWLDDVKKQQTKAPMPILSFPSASLLGVSVKDLTTNSTLQAQGMKAIADRHQSLASVSMMDLSVEAEAFGASVKFSDNEVPVVTNPLVESYDDAENLTVPSVSAGRCPLYVETIKIAINWVGKENPNHARPAATKHPMATQIDTKSTVIISKIIASTAITSQISA